MENKFLSEKQIFAYPFQEEDIEDWRYNRLRISRI
jgi:hypothetical protein